jgi:DHA1 family tetracycline resistance protein-like MFS transporter
VLLISLFGAAISYMLMASASRLWMLLVGRAIAGLTNAIGSKRLAELATTSLR